MGTLGILGMSRRHIILSPAKGPKGKRLTQLLFFSRPSLFFLCGCFDGTRQLAGSDNCHTSGETGRHTARTGDAVGKYTGKDEPVDGGRPLHCYVIARDRSSYSRRPAMTGQGTR